MTSNDTSWYPPRGRYHVEVAASVTKALKARKVKGEIPTTTKRSKIPDRDFHSLRYNFHPPSLDRDHGVGSITVKTGKDVTSVSVERSSVQPGEGSLFNGSEQPAKEWECILIFDEVKKKFVFEKLDSSMALTFERKITMPVPARAAQPAESSRPKTKDLSREAEELEKQYLGADEDAVGEIDDEFEEIIPQSIAQRQEEEEEEEIHIPPPPQPSLPKAKPKPTRPAKPSALPPAQNPTPAAPAPTPAQKPRQPPKSTPLPPKPKPAPQQRGKKNKRELEPPHPHPDAEELEFGKPAKRARPSPPSEGLALPGASTAVYAPPPPVPLQTSAPRRVSPPPPPGPLSESEEEEEWDEVAAVDKAVNDNPEDNFDIFGEAGATQDIEMDAFERELNMQMEESDEDFLDAVEPDGDVEEPVRGMPIPLAQLAANANGGVGYASEDEYSSSDDSDDD